MTGFPPKAIVPSESSPRRYPRGALEALPPLYRAAAEILAEEGKIIIEEGSP